MALLLFLLLLLFCNFCAFNVVRTTETQRAALMTENKRAKTSFAGRERVPYGYIFLSVCKYRCSNIELYRFFSIINPRLLKLNVSSISNDKEHAHVVLSKPKKLSISCTCTFWSGFLFFCCYYALEMLESAAFYFY